jgi:hypothetical protein
MLEMMDDDHWLFDLPRRRRASLAAFAAIGKARPVRRPPATLRRSTDAR